MRLRPVKDRVIVKHLKTNPSSILHMPDGSYGTFTKSLLTGSESLREVDAGNVRLNLGEVVEINQNTKLSIKKGDVVLYKQGSGLACMGLSDSENLARIYGEDKEHYYVISESALVAHLPEGNPGDGVFR